MLALVLAVAVSQSLAATTLNVAWPSNVGPLNPHLYSPNQMFAQAMVYEPLVRYMPDGSVSPWLATSWKISQDGRIYTFTLRQGVKFTDGQAFDATAVKKNFDAILANRKRHEWLELFSQLDRVEVVDAHTVRLQLRHAYYPALYDLSLIRPARFLSPAAVPAGGSTAEAIKAPAGTGPWILVESRLGEYDLFRRNDAYWGVKPKFDFLRVKVLPDINTRAVALQTGEVDLVFGSGSLSRDTFARFRKTPGLHAAISQPMATRMLALNSRCAPTSELPVRQAILRAVDRQAILSGILYNVDEPADALFAPRMPYANIGLKAPAFDPKAAAGLLEAAGWKLDPATRVRMKNGRPLEIELAFVGNDGVQKAVSEAIQANLAAIGIRIRLIGEEANSIFARQKDGRFGMIFGDTWGAPYDPHSYLSSMRQPSHADYQAQLGLPMKAEIDAKIGKALTSTSDKERATLFGQVLKTLHEQAVYLPISHETAMEAHRDSIGNVGFGAMLNEFPFERITPQGR